MNDAVSMHKLSFEKASSSDEVAARRRRRRFFEFKADIPHSWAILLGALVWVCFFGLWEFAVWQQWTSEILLPGPGKVLAALHTLFTENNALTDIGVSVDRVLLSFVLACLVAVLLGVLMGSFRTVEAFFNPLVSAWRYLPAPSFIPLLLMWLGAGDAQKLALLFIGVIWFMIAMMRAEARNDSEAA